jgi:hypothetical protein
MINVRAPIRQDLWVNLTGRLNLLGQGIVRITDDYPHAKQGLRIEFPDRVKTQACV